MSTQCSSVCVTLTQSSNSLFYSYELVVQSKRRAKEKAELKQTEERNAISKKRSRNGNHDGKEFVDSEEDADFSLSDSWRPVNQKPKSQRSKIRFPKYSTFSFLRKQSSTDADDTQDIYNSKDSLSPESSSPLDGLAHADESKIVCSISPTHSHHLASCRFCYLYSTSEQCYSKPLHANGSYLQMICVLIFLKTFQPAHSLPYGVITSAGIDFEASLIDPVNRGVSYFVT